MDHPVSTFRLPVPRQGDVLASRPTARADNFAISVIPASTHTVVRRHADAIAAVREFAREHAVDAWYTCDHIHFLRVAQHRSREERSWLGR
jgi:hypothetical protein